MPKIIPTLGDGNCAYNAFSLGIQELLNVDLICSFPDEFLSLMSERAILLTNASIAGLKEFRVLKRWILSLSQDEVQSYLSPVLRELAVQYLRNCYSHTSLDAEFQNAVDEGTIRHSTNPFHIEKILRGANAQPNPERVMNWWRNKGRKIYLDHIQQPATDAGDLQRWGSQVEIAALANLFDLRVLFTDRSPRLDGGPYPTYELGFTHGRVERRLEFAELTGMNILQEFNGLYTFSPHIRTKKILGTILKKIHYRSELLRQLTTINFDNWNEAHTDNTYTQTKFEQWISIVPQEHRRECIESLKYRGIDKSIFSQSGENKHQYLEQVINTIETRIRDVPKGIKKILENVYIENVPCLELNKTAAHWEFVSQIQTNSIFEETDTSHIDISSIPDVDYEQSNDEMTTHKTYQNDESAITHYQSKSLNDIQTDLPIHSDSIPKIRHIFENGTLKQRIDFITRLNLNVPETDETQIEPLRKIKELVVSALEAQCQKFENTEMLVNISEDTISMLKITSISLIVINDKLNVDETTQFVKDITAHSKLLIKKFSDEWKLRLNESNYHWHRDNLPHLNLITMLSTSFSVPNSSANLTSQLRESLLKKLTSYSKINQDNIGSSQFLELLFDMEALSKHFPLNEEIKNLAIKIETFLSTSSYYNSKTISIPIKSLPHEFLSHMNIMSIYQSKSHAVMNSNDSNNPIASITAMTQQGKLEIEKQIKKEKDQILQINESHQNKIQSLKSQLNDLDAELHKNTIRKSEYETRLTTLMSQLGKDASAEKSSSSNIQSMLNTDYLEIVKSDVSESSNIQKAMAGQSIREQNMARLQETINKITAKVSAVQENIESQHATMSGLENQKIKSQNTIQQWENELINAQKTHQGLQKNKDEATNKTNKHKHDLDHYPAYSNPPAHADMELPDSFTIQVSSCAGPKTCSTNSFIKVNGRSIIAYRKAGIYAAVIDKITGRTLESTSFAFWDAGDTVEGKTLIVTSAESGVNFINKWKDHANVIFILVSVDHSTRIKEFTKKESLSYSRVVIEHIDPITTMERTVRVESGKVCTQLNDALKSVGFQNYSTIQHRQPWYCIKGLDGGTISRYEQFKGISGAEISGKFIASEVYTCSAAKAHKAPLKKAHETACKQARAAYDAAKSTVETAFNTARNELTTIEKSLVTATNNIKSLQDKIALEKNQLAQHSTQIENQNQYINENKLVLRNLKKSLESVQSSYNQELENVHPQTVESHHSSHQDSTLASPQSKIKCIETDLYKNIAIQLSSLGYEKVSTLISPGKSKTKIPQAISNLASKILLSESVLKEALRSSLALMGTTKIGVYYSFSLFNNTYCISYNKGSDSYDIQTIISNACLEFISMDICGHIIYFKMKNRSDSESTAPIIFIHDTRKNSWNKAALNYKNLNKSAYQIANHNIYSGIVRESHFTLQIINIPKKAENITLPSLSINSVNFAWKVFYKKNKLYLATNEQTRVSLYEFNSESNQWNTLAHTEWNDNNNQINTVFEFGLFITEDTVYITKHNRDVILTFTYKLEDVPPKNTLTQISFDVKPHTSDESASESSNIVLFRNDSLYFIVKKITHIEILRFNPDFYAWDSYMKINHDAITWNSSLKLDFLNFKENTYCIYVNNEHLVLATNRKFDIRNDVHITNTKLTKLTSLMSSLENRRAELKYQLLQAENTGELPEIQGINSRINELTTIYSSVEDEEKNLFKLHSLANRAYLVGFQSHPSLENNTIHQFLASLLVGILDDTNTDYFYQFTDSQNPQIPDEFYFHFNRILSNAGGNASTQPSLSAEYINKILRFCEKEYHVMIHLKLYLSSNSSSIEYGSSTNKSSKSLTIVQYDNSFLLVLPSSHISDDSKRLHDLYTYAIADQYLLKRLSSYSLLRFSPSGLDNLTTDDLKKYLTISIQELDSITHFELFKNLFAEPSALTEYHNTTLSYFKFDMSIIDAFIDYSNTYQLGFLHESPKALLMRFKKAYSNSLKSYVSTQIKHISTTQQSQSNEDLSVHAMIQNELIRKQNELQLLKEKLQELNNQANNHSNNMNVNAQAIKELKGKFKHYTSELDKKSNEINQLVKLKEGELQQKEAMLKKNSTEVSTQEENLNKNLIQINNINNQIKDENTKINTLVQNQQLLVTKQSDMLATVESFMIDKSEIESRIAELEKNQRKINLSRDFINSLKSNLEAKSALFLKRKMILNKLSELTHDQSVKNRFKNLYSYLVKELKISFNLTPPDLTILDDTNDLFFESCELIRSIMAVPSVEFVASSSTLRIKANTIYSSEIMEIVKSHIQSQLSKYDLTIKNSTLFANNHPSLFSQMPEQLIELFKKYFQKHDLPDPQPCTILNGKTDNQSEISQSWGFIKYKDVTNIRNRINNDFQIPIEELYSTYYSGVEVIASNTIILDSNITLPGTNLTLKADSIHIPNNVTINTSGLHALEYINKIARHGNNPAYRRHNQNKPCGSAGEPGLHGMPGMSAGHITVDASTTLNDLNRLTCLANGGNGAAGQQGGNGDDGIEGPKGKDAVSINDYYTKQSTKKVIQVIIPPLPGVTPAGKIIEKNISGPGGDAGDYGLGGLGGNSGSILILKNKVPQISPNSESQPGKVGLPGGKAATCGAPGLPPYMGTSLSVKRGYRWVTYCLVLEKKDWFTESGYGEWILPTGFDNLTLGIGNGDFSDLVSSSSLYYYSDLDESSDYKHSRSFEALILTPKTKSSYRFRYVFVGKDNWLPAAPRNPDGSFIPKRSVDLRCVSSKKSASSQARSLHSRQQAKVKANSYEKISYQSELELELQSLQLNTVHEQILQRLQDQQSKYNQQLTHANNELTQINKEISNSQLVLSQISEALVIGQSQIDHSTIHLTKLNEEMSNVLALQKSNAEQLIHNIAGNVELNQSISSLTQEIECAKIDLKSLITIGERLDSILQHNIALIENTTLSEDEKRQLLNNFITETQKAIATQEKLIKNLEDRLSQELNKKNEEIESAGANHQQQNQDIALSNQTAHQDEYLVSHANPTSTLNKSLTQRPIIQTKEIASAISSAPKSTHQPQVDGKNIINDVLTFKNKKPLTSNTLSQYIHQTHISSKAKLSQESYKTLWENLSQISSYIQNQGSAEYDALLNELTYNITCLSTTYLSEISEACDELNDIIISKYTDFTINDIHLVIQYRRQLFSYLLHEIFLDNTSAKLNVSTLIQFLTTIPPIVSNTDRYPDNHNNLFSYAHDRILNQLRILTRLEIHLEKCKLSPELTLDDAEAPIKELVTYWETLTAELHSATHNASQNTGIHFSFESQFEIKLLKNLFTGCINDPGFIFVNVLKCTKQLRSKTIKRVYKFLEDLCASTREKTINDDYTSWLGSILNASNNFSINNPLTLDFICTLPNTETRQKKIIRILLQQINPLTLNSEHSILQYLQTRASCEGKTIQSVLTEFTHYFIQEMKSCVESKLVTEFPTSNISDSSAIISEGISLLPECVSETTTINTLLIVHNQLQSLLDSLHTDSAHDALDAFINTKQLLLRIIKGSVTPAKFTQIQDFYQYTIANFSPELSNRVLYCLENELSLELVLFLESYVFANRTKLIKNTPNSNKVVFYKFLYNINSYIEKHFIESVHKQLQDTEKQLTNESESKIIPFELISRFRDYYTQHDNHKKVIEDQDKKQFVNYVLVKASSLGVDIPTDATIPSLIISINEISCKKFIQNTNQIQFLALKENQCAKMSPSEVIRLWLTKFNNLVRSEFLSILNTANKELLYDFITSFIVDEQPQQEQIISISNYIDIKIEELSQHEAANLNKAIEFLNEYSELLKAAAYRYDFYRNFSLITSLYFSKTNSLLARKLLNEAKSLVNNNLPQWLSRSYLANIDRSSKMLPIIHNFEFQHFVKQPETIYNNFKQEVISDDSQPDSVDKVLLNVKTNLVSLKQQMDISIHINTLKLLSQIDFKSNIEKIHHIIDIFLDNTRASDLDISIELHLTLLRNILPLIIDKYKEDAFIKFTTHKLHQFSHRHPLIALNIVKHFFSDKLIFMPKSKSEIIELFELDHLIKIESLGTHSPENHKRIEYILLLSLFSQNTDPSQLSKKFIDCYSNNQLSHEYYSLLIESIHIGTFTKVLSWGNHSDNLDFSKRLISLTNHLAQQSLNSVLIESQTQHLAAYTSFSEMLINTLNTSCTQGTILSSISSLATALPYEFMLNKLLTHDERVFYQNIPDNRRNREIYIEQPSSQWLSNIKATYWNALCLRLMRPIKDEMININPGMASSFDSFITTESILSSETQKTLLINSQPTSDKNTAILNHHIESIHTLKEKLIHSYEIASSQGAIFTWMLLINKIIPLLDKQVISLNNVSDMLRLTEYKFELDTLYNQLSPSEDKHIMFNIMTAFVTQMAIRHLQNNFSGKITNTHLTEGIFKTEKGTRLLRNIGFALNLERTNKYHFNVDMFNTLITTLIKQRIYDNEILIDKLAELPISLWANYIERYEYISKLPLDIRTSAHEEFIETIVELKSVFSNEHLFSTWFNMIATLELNSDSCFSVINNTCNLFAYHSGCAVTESLLKQLGKSNWTSWLSIVNDYIRSQTTELTRLEICEEMTKHANDYNNAFPDMLTDTADTSQLFHILTAIDTGSRIEIQKESLLENINQFKNSRQNPFTLNTGLQSNASMNSSPGNAKSKKIKKSSLTFNTLEQDIIDFLVLVNQVMYDLKGFYLRETQLVAIIGFILAIPKNTGRLANIHTGEGKTIITQVVAIACALKGERVFILTSSQALAEPQSVEAQGLLSAFNLKATNNCDNECVKDDNLRRTRYETYHVIYGDIGSFQRDKLITQTSSREICVNKPTSLIIDEVDSLLIDNASRTLYLSHPIHDLSKFKRIFESIWHYVVAVPELHEFSELTLNTAIKLFNTEHQTLINELYELEAYYNLHIGDWFKSAYIARDMLEDIHYSVMRDKDDYVKVIINDIATGVEQTNSRWSNGLHIFLDLKHQLESRNESLRALFESNLTYVQSFSDPAHGEGKLYGMSGTLGDVRERELLHSHYHVDFMDIPRFKRRNFIMEPALIVNEQSWIPEIIKAVNEKLNQQQPYSQEQIDAAVKLCAQLNPKISRLRQAILEQQKASTNRKRLLSRTTELKKSTSANDEVIIDDERINKNINELDKLCIQYENAQSITKHLSSRAIWIMCDNKKSAKLISTALTTQLGKEPQIYNSYLQPFRLQTKQIQPNDIIISTNIGSRGTDFEISDTLRRVGGIFILATFLPSNSRTEHQLLGRASRNGDPGSAKFIIADNRVTPNSHITIQQLKNERDYLESERLVRISQHEVPTLQLSQELFEEFLKHQTTIKNEIQSQHSLITLLQYFSAYIKSHITSSTNQDILMKENLDVYEKYKMIYNKLLFKSNRIHQAFIAVHNTIRLLPSKNHSSKYDDLKSTLSTLTNQLNAGVLYQFASDYRNAFTQLQLKSLQDKWALWLDAKSEMIGNLGKDNTIRGALLTELRLWLNDLLNKMLEQSFLLITSPGELQQLGNLFREHDNTEMAITCYDQIIRLCPHSSPYAHYYKAISRLKNGGKSAAGKTEAYAELEIALRRIQEKVSQLNSACDKYLMTCNIHNHTSGSITSNQYIHSLQKEIQILSIHAQSITHAIGSSVCISELECSGLDLENRTMLYNRFIQVGILTPFRWNHTLVKVTEDATGICKFYYENNPIKLPYLLSGLESCIIEKYVSNQADSQQGTDVYALIQSTALSSTRFIEIFSEYISVTKAQPAYRISLPNKISAFASSSFWENPIFKPHGSLIKKGLESLLKNNSETKKYPCNELYNIIKNTDPQLHSLTKSQWDIITSLLSENKIISTTTVDKYQLKIKAIDTLTNYFENLTIRPDLSDSAIENELIIPKYTKLSSYMTNIVTFLKKYRGKVISLEKFNNEVTIDSASNLYPEFLDYIVGYGINVNGLCSQLLKHHNSSSIVISYYKRVIDDIFFDLYKNHKSSQFIISDIALLRPDDTDAINYALNFFINEHIIDGPHFNFNCGISDNENTIKSAKSNLHNQITNVIKTAVFINRTDLVVPSKKLLARFNDIEKRIHDKVVDKQKKDSALEIGIKRAQYQKEAIQTLNEEDKQIYLYEITRRKSLDTFSTRIINLSDDMIGFLKITHKVELYKQTLTQCLASSPLSLIAREYIDMGLNDVLSLIEYIEPEHDESGAQLCILLGVVQIVVGAMVCTVNPVIGGALISEGVGDIIYATIAMKQGNFSWNSYWLRKRESLKWTIALMAVQLYVGGAKYGKELTASAVFLKSTLDAAEQIATNFLLIVIKQKAIEELIKGVTEKALKAINEEIDDVFNSISSYLVKESKKANLHLKIPQLNMDMMLTIKNMFSNMNMLISDIQKTSNMIMALIRNPKLDFEKMSVKDWAFLIIDLANTYMNAQEVIDHVDNIKESARNHLNEFLYTNTPSMLVFVETPLFNEEKVIQEINTALTEHKEQIRMKLTPIVKSLLSNVAGSVLDFLRVNQLIELSVSSMFSKAHSYLDQFKIQTTPKEPILGSLEFGLNLNLNLDGQPPSLSLLTPLGPLPKSILENPNLIEISGNITSLLESGEMILNIKNFSDKISNQFFSKLTQLSDTIKENLQTIIEKAVNHIKPVIVKLENLANEYLKKLHDYLDEDKIQDSLEGIQMIGFYFITKGNNENMRKIGNILMKTGQIINDTHSNLTDFLEREEGISFADVAVDKMKSHTKSFTDNIVSKAHNTIRDEYHRYESHIIRQLDASLKIVTTTSHILNELSTSATQEAKKMIKDAKHSLSKIKDEEIKAMQKLNDAKNQLHDFVVSLPGSEEDLLDEMEKFSYPPIFKK